MPTDIVIPSLGESVTEGVIASWLKNEGDSVDRDEPVLELETDKITMEIPAPVAGVVSQKAKEGDTVKVGDVIGAIDESGDGSGSGSKKSAKEKEASKGTGGAEEKADSGNGKKASSDAKREKKDDSASTAVADDDGPSGGDNGAASRDGARMTPLARKIAKERGVDVSSLSGTGPGGRIREQDVLAYLDSKSAEAPAKEEKREAKAPEKSDKSDKGEAPKKKESSPALSPGSRETTRTRMSPLRQRIAARLVEAQHTAAMLTTFNECDMTKVMELRKRHKEAFEKRHGVGLGFMSFFVKACVNALEAFPLVNAQIVEGDNGPETVQHHYCDIAVAVGTPKGLVVPVIRNCESLSFAGIESEIRAVAEKARDGKLTLEDMQGGTFTISNGGVYGSMMSTPILNPPQSGILGMHNIVRRPVEHPDKPGEIAIRPMMYLALSYDHRIVDGAEAVGFLKRVKECIEDPERLLLQL
ncbi:MAG: 2-oxoglutarate dehydrogenase complex dihydrolipoyllysine-residue succinyltransferase [Phycisphaeraceae bacterium]|nr:MAG: 2-oxoglutarate dehydrogenase complex dihydrolipoyllysine-residue succinyltransferase [Phycisphaeraceae bacterium]